MGVALAGRIAAVVTVASLGGANLFGRGSIRAAAVEPCGGARSLFEPRIYPRYPRCSGLEVALPGVPGVKVLLRVHRHRVWIQRIEQHEGEEHCRPARLIAARHLTRTHPPILNGHSISGF